MSLVNILSIMKKCKDDKIIKIILHTMWKATNRHPMKTFYEMITTKLKYKWWWTNLFEYLLLNFNHTMYYLMNLFDRLLLAPLGYIKCNIKCAENKILNREMMLQRRVTFCASRIRFVGINVCEGKKEFSIKKILKIRT